MKKRKAIKPRAIRRPHPVPSPEVTLDRILQQAQAKLQAEGAGGADAYLETAARVKPGGLSLDGLRLALARRVGAAHPAVALALLEKSLQEGQAGADEWGLAASLQDRLGQRKAARDSAVRVIEAPTATPEQVLGACNLLVRLENGTRALEAAKKAYAELGQPLRWTASLLYIALKVADWPTAGRLIGTLQAAYAEGRLDEARESPRTHLLWCGDEATNLAVIQAWSRRHLPLPAHAVPPVPPPSAGRRLRVGYLSSDFREHPTARLVNGLFRHHDRDRFELYMYCSGWDDGSPLRKAVASHFDHLHSVAGLSDAEAARLIRSHGIDVLVELNGPTRAHRMGILAHRPAPVQIDYLGWPGSVGGRVVDYVVGDLYTVPPGAEAGYPEKVIRLRETYQVNDYRGRTLPPAPSRAQVGLPDGVPVLGMFNAINKVRAEVWGVWMQILKAVPEAVLWLLDPGVAARCTLARLTHAYGIDPKRVIAAPPLPQAAHLARLQSCDLMLDPWPYGGHTSTSDALFAGVPVLALEGRNFAGRVSGGLLRAAGLEALVQPDAARYARAAVGLLRSPEALAAVRRAVAEKVPRSDVFDARAKARQLEAAYRQAVDWAAAGQPPQHIGPLPPQGAAIRKSAPYTPEAVGAAETQRSAMLPATRPELVLVCGPWGSGTSAVAGMLAKAGLHAPGPYVRVNDARTSSTFEMVAWQEVLKALASEETMIRHADDEAALRALKAFRDDVLLPALSAEGHEDKPVMLKHALAALFLPQLCELFEVRLVGVMRPLRDIESTRVRRNWRAYYGAESAGKIYRCIFDHLVNSDTPFHWVRYPELLARPEAELDKLLAFCDLRCSDAGRRAALYFVERPSAAAVGSPSDLSCTPNASPDRPPAPSSGKPVASSVTALLPAWQAAEFIQPTLDALSAQTYADFRVLVSVDRCDDDTHAICQAHAAHDPRFRVIRQDRRLGYVGNCNFLLDQAETDYVLFAFHDDILKPEYVASLAEVLDARPEAIISFSDVLLTHVSGRQEHWEFTALEGLRDRLQRAALMLQPVDKWWVPNRGLFRLQAARRINGLKTHGAGEFSSDLPWLFHMSLLGEFARVPETLCYKYYKPGSLSRSWAFTPRQIYEMRAACLRELWNSGLSAEERAQLAGPVTTWLLKNRPVEVAS
jgi:hypothetical protein